MYPKPRNYGSSRCRTHRSAQAAGGRPLPIAHDSAGASRRHPRRAGAPRAVQSAGRALSAVHPPKHASFSMRKRFDIGKSGGPYSESIGWRRKPRGKARRNMNGAALPLLVNEHTLMTFGIARGTSFAATYPWVRADWLGPVHSSPNSEPSVETGTPQPVSTAPRPRAHPQRPGPSIFAVPRWHNPAPGRSERPH